MQKAGALSCPSLWAYGTPQVSKLIIRQMPYKSRLASNVQSPLALTRSGLVGLNRRQHLFRVALGPDLGEDLQESLVGTDDEGGPFDADHFLAVHVLFLEHPKLIAHLFVYICEEWIRQVELFPEFALCLGRIAGDSEHHRAGFLELFKGVAEAAGLNGAARCVRLGIKEEYDWL